MSEYNLNVTVNLKKNGDRMDVTILFPRNQPSLTVTDSAIILASGLSLLIRSCSKTEGVTDAELMRNVVDFLNEQFINTDSFNDAKVFEDVFKK